LASRQGFGELKTEQLGGHSQEQQRHRQAPIDDDDELLKVSHLKSLHNTADDNGPSSTSMSATK